MAQRSRIQEMRDAQRSVSIAEAVDYLKHIVVWTMARDATALCTSIEYHAFVATYLDNDVSDFDSVVVAMKQASVDLDVSNAWLSFLMCGTWSRLHMSWQ